MPPEPLRDPGIAIPRYRLRELQHVVHQLTEDVYFNAGPCAIQLASFTRNEGQKRYVFHLLILEDAPHNVQLIHAMADDVEAALEVLPGYAPGIATVDVR
jgi:hypothetical protein